VLSRAHRHPRRQRGHGLVADVLVDDIGRLPQPLQVDSGVEPDPGKRLRDRFGPDPVHGQRDGIHRGGDHVGAGS